MVNDALLKELVFALKENAIPLEEAAIIKLLHYLKLLQTWNKVFNLTAITQPREMIYLHLIDSLKAAPYLTGNCFLDVGSGAGLPGIPLATAHAGGAWVLLDKNSKKTRFMTQAVAELDLNQVEVVQKRVEEFHPAQGFDSILSRAFGSLQLFLETTKHLLAPGGTFIAMKGKFPEAELAHIPEHFLVCDCIRLDVKGRKEERHLVLVKKNEVLIAL